MKKISFDAVVRALAKYRFPKADLVVGIENGGKVPAALVAYRLGKDVAYLTINYRDEMNRPRHPRPIVLKPLKRLKGVKKILLVDDAAMTGQTLTLARKMLGAYDVRTFVLKGKADHVLFPKIKACVAWPWKKLLRRI